MKGENEMNIDTGELKLLYDLNEKEKESFTKIPKELSQEAELLLKGERSATVDLNKVSLLSDWANEIKEIERETGHRLSRKKRRAIAIKLRRQNKID